MQIRRSALTPSRVARGLAAQVHDVHGPVHERVRGRGAASEVERRGGSRGTNRQSRRSASVALLVDVEVRIDTGRLACARVGASRSFCRRTSVAARLRSAWLASRSMSAKSGSRRISGSVACFETVESGSWSQLPHAAESDRYQPGSGGCWFGCSGRDGFLAAAIGVANPAADLSALEGEERLRRSKTVRLCNNGYHFF